MYLQFCGIDETSTLITLVSPGILKVKVKRTSPTVLSRDTPTITSYAHIGQIPSTKRSARNLRRKNICDRIPRIFAVYYEPVTCLAEKLLYAITADVAF